MGKITRDTIIHKALKSYPGTGEVFDAHHMRCKSCGGGKVETVAWGASTHGLEVESFLKELSDAADGGQPVTK